jgi:hypothetical protein
MSTTATPTLPPAPQHSWELHPGIGTQTDAVKIDHIVSTKTTIARFAVTARNSPGWPDVAPALAAELQAEVDASLAKSKHRERLAELDKQADQLQAEVMEALARLVVRDQLGDVERQAVQLKSRAGAAAAELQALTAAPATEDVLAAVHALDARLRGWLGTIAGQVQAVATRRSDPALLAAENLSAEVERLNAEEQDLIQQRKAAQEALAVLQPHLHRARREAAAETRAVALAALERRRQTALDRRSALLLQLAAAIGPVLDELVATTAEVGALNDRLLTRLNLPDAVEASPTAAMPRVPVGAVEV